MICEEERVDLRIQDPKSIEEGKTGQVYVYVKFAKTEKSFGFPGAFYDGYLSVK